MAHNLLQVQGSAVKKGKAGEWNQFVITPKEDFEGALGAIIVGFDGVSKPKLEFDYGSDKVIVKYWPTLPGTYRLEITKGGMDIPGSPFTTVVAPANAADPEKIVVTGPGLTKALPNSSNEIIVDVTEAYIIGKLKAYMSGKAFPMRKYGKPDIFVDDEQKPGLHIVHFIPKFAGTFKLFLEFEKIKVPGSPFPIVVEDPINPSQPEQWPTRCRPKRVLFTTPEPQRLAFVARPVAN